MFAIVEVAGQQFKVEKDQNIFVHRLNEKEGGKIVLDKVLLVEEKGTALVGTPTVEGYTIKATVLTHVKGDKVKVFKKKRRKGYQVMNGHRQYFTEIHIDDIEKGKAPAKKAADKGETPAEKSVKAEKAAVPAKKTEPKAKAAAKPAAKKTTAVKKETEAKRTKAKTTQPNAKKATVTKKAGATKAKTAAKPKATAKTETKKKTTPDKNSDTSKEKK
ncbi:MAG: 50S ribosomal protein L21 [Bacteroidales bacterium]|nr:50S ribosomal protein L21 [Bacteroidales bacterium]